MSEKLVPGDIVVVREAGEVEALKELPCDAVILSGECVMQEASLTGESVPITKVCFPNFNTLSF